MKSANLCLPVCILWTLLCATNYAAEPLSTTDTTHKTKTSAQRQPAPAAAQTFPELDVAIVALKAENFADNPAYADSVIHHKIRPHESVERIIKKYYSQLPFKPSSLVALVTQLNPQVVPANTRGSLPAGRTLVFPKQSLLRAILLGKSTTTITSSPYAEASTQQTAGDSGDWVHYP